MRNRRLVFHDSFQYNNDMEPQPSGFTSEGSPLDQTIQNQIDILKDIIVKTVPVEQIYLFGSYAYGMPTSDSDLDLYVIMKDDAPLPALEAEQKIALASIGHKKMAADILVLTKSRFQRRLTAPTLEREVSQKGIVIYG